VYVIEIKTFKKSLSNIALIAADNVLHRPATPRMKSMRPAIAERLDNPGLSHIKLVQSYEICLTAVVMLFAQFDPTTVIVIRWAHCHLALLSAASRNILAMAESWYDLLV